SIAATPFIGAEFIPAGDQGQMSIDVETREGTSNDTVLDIVDEINDVLAEKEDIIDVSFVSVGDDSMGMGMGGSDGGASYTIQLDTPKDRDISKVVCEEELKQRVTMIVGAEVTVSEMDAGMGMGDPNDIEITGPKYEVLRDLADTIVDEISYVDGVLNPESAAGAGVPQLHVEIDDELAAAHGLTVESIQQQIEMNFIGSVVSQYSEAGQELDITIKYQDSSRETISDLEDMKVMTQTGASIPLAELATFVEKQGPVALIRQNQQSQMN